MDQKQWEQRLDRVADRVSGAVSEGVRILEDAFEKGKDALRDEPRGPGAEGPGVAGTTGAAGATRTVGAAGSTGTAGPAESTPSRGSPRLGLLLVAIGILWLLHALGILDQPVFPILLIIVGVYFIVRSK